MQRKGQNSYLSATTLPVSRRHRFIHHETLEKNTAITKRTLITGQDGSYLAEFLLEKS
jgi:hypothetical protein